MSIKIRRAEKKDIAKVSLLLQEVLTLHAKIRPDIFIPGTVKYTAEELERIFEDERTPVFVAADEADTVLGYAFCIMKSQPFRTNMKDFKTLFIDDICVDENSRGQHGTDVLDLLSLSGVGHGQPAYAVTVNTSEYFNHK